MKRLLPGHDAYHEFEAQYGARYGIANQERVVSDTLPTVKMWGRVRGGGGGCALRKKEGLAKNKTIIACWQWMPRCSNLQLSNARLCNAELHILAEDHDF